MCSRPPSVLPSAAVVQFKRADGVPSPGGLAPERQSRGVRCCLVYGGGGRFKRQGRTGRGDGDSYDDDDDDGEEEEEDEEDDDDDDDGESDDYGASGGARAGRPSLARLATGPARMVGNQCGTLAVAGGAREVTWSFPDDPKDGASDGRVMISCDPFLVQV